MMDSDLDTLDRGTSTVEKMGASVWEVGLLGEDVDVASAFRGTDAGLLFEYVARGFIGDSLLMQPVDADQSFSDVIVRTYGADLERSIGHGGVSATNLLPHVSLWVYRDLDSASAHRDSAVLYRECLPNYADSAVAGMWANPGSTGFDEFPDFAKGSTVIDGPAMIFEDHVTDAFVELFRSAANEVFHDGMDNSFRQEAGLAIEVYGDVAVRALQRAVHDGSCDVEVIEESLRLLGDIDDVRTHHARLAVLVDELGSENARVRDAASVGIASLGDPGAAYSVRCAIERERSSRVRRNLESALSALDASAWPTS